MKFSWLIFLCCGAMGASADADARPFHPARVTHDLSLAQDLEALDRAVIALALGDRADAAARLRAGGIEPHLAGWLRGRVLMDEANYDRAVTVLEDAAQDWRRSLRRPEPLTIVREFDRDRLEAAIHARKWRQARRIMNDPRADHAGDQIWEALGAAVVLGSGRATTAQRALDAAWAAATKAERRHWAFGWRAVAILRNGDADRAADAWLDFTDGLKSSAEVRQARKLWDDSPTLGSALAVDGRRLRGIRWLARILRRDLALELAVDGYERATGREQAECFVAAAEQMYRLRQHDELLTHLARPRPAALDAEELASLDAYVWGVRRRQGISADVARGFDQVVADHDGTARATEALWEAAWMWELSGDTETARHRFLTYARNHSKGPFAHDAGVRALYLSLKAGDHDQVMATFQSLYAQGGPGEGMAEAAALWVVARASAARNDTQTSSRLSLRLSDQHQDSPWLLPPPSPLRTTPPGRAGIDELLEDLYRAQLEALTAVAKEVGLSLESSDLPAPLDLAERCFQLGLFDKGESQVADYAAQGRRDAKTQLRALALCWRYGRAERQARVGYQLRLLLRGKSAILDRHLDVLAHPTPYAREVLQASDQLGLPAGLLWALMRRESFYEADVISFAGAHGLMQLLPSTAERMATKLGDPMPPAGELRRPRLNVRYGTAYLAQLLDEAEGNVYRALASYNAGESNGERWLARLPEDAPPQEMILLISYSETRAYVYHVLRFWRLYSRVYAQLGQYDGLVEP